MDRPELTDAQQEQLTETMQRGVEFEEIVRSKGFERIRANYENRIRLFVNNLLLHDEKKIEEFENERYELIGLRKLFGSIESDLKVLRDERERTKPTTNE
jgi:hypothetical protein